MIIFTGEKGKENKELSVLLDESSVREIIGTFKDNEKYFEAVTKHYKNKDAEDYEVKNIEASYFPDQVRNYVKQYGGVKLQNEGAGLPNYYGECITEPHLQGEVMTLLHNEIDLDEADSKIKNSIDDGESPEDLANEPFLKQDEVNAVLKMSEVKESIEDMAKSVGIPEAYVNDVKEELVKDELAKKLEDGGEIVQKAPHYQNIPLKDRNGNVVELEAWEIITSILDYLKLNPRASWAMGDALKYILRCGRKFGDEKAKTKDDKAIQDLRKVAYYINKVADWYQN